jgi:hypothetical protein
MIRYRITEVLFGIAEARKGLLAADPQAQLALSLFGEAEKLAGVGKTTGARQAGR